MKKNEEFVKCCGGIQPETVKPMNGITELVFIIDRSGSMSGLEADTIGGFNATIDAQKEKGGKVYVSTVLFDHESVVLHDRVDIEKIEPMTRKDYQVRGSTALLDAIGGAMHHIKNVHRYARAEDVPEHTIFVITTDGMENASRTYSKRMIKDRIRIAQSERGWEFLFLGANIDAFEAAEGLGIRRDRAANYRYDRQGVSESYTVMSNAIKCMRDCDADFDLDEMIKGEEKKRVKK